MTTKHLRKSMETIPPTRLVGASKAIKRVRHLLTQVAASDTTVLITGESGTGKEDVARSLHEQSTRNAQAFVPINCGAIPHDLLESELFGHEKGAFTGAISQRIGRFELAAGGTLFLDEIGDMSLGMQVKLLRVLQEHCFERVGSNQSIASDVRIIAATHRDLEASIANGSFRQDLYYRLNVFPIEMLPLRERMEDLPLLVKHLIAARVATGQAGVQMMPGALQSLTQYQWPGNVRELVNLIERLSILYPNKIIEHYHLPKKFQGSLTPPSIFKSIEKTTLSSQEEDGVNFQLPKMRIDLKEHLSETEKSLIKQALHEANWVVTHAANTLNVRRTTLVEKMRKYNLSKKEDSTAYE